MLSNRCKDAFPPTNAFFLTSKKNYLRSHLFTTFTIKSTTDTVKIERYRLQYGHPLKR